jgi:hypothetical protein
MSGNETMDLPMMKLLRQTRQLFAVLVFAVAAHAYGPLQGVAWSESTWPAAKAGGFIVNIGQWPREVEFAARSGPVTLCLHRDGATIGLAGGDPSGQSTFESLRLSVEQASTDPTVAGVFETGRVHNFFLGKDPSRWRTNVPAFAAVKVSSLYEGVDLLWRQSEGGFEFDFELSSEADQSAIVLRIDGTDQLDVGANGELEARARSGVLRVRRPIAWVEQRNGHRNSVACSYEVLDTSRVAIKCARIASGERLCIDPALEWSSFLGGSGGEALRAISLGSDGALTIAGETSSFDYPVTLAAFDPIYDRGVFAADVVVSSIMNGVLSSSTYLGGSANDWVVGMRVAESGDVVVGGLTASPNFPTTAGAYSTMYKGGGDGYIARITSNGTALIYSTLIGGTGVEDIGGLAVADDGSVLISGSTTSMDYPVSPDAYDTVKDGGAPNAEGFVTRMSADGSSILRSTFFGGSGSDGIGAVASTTDGSVITLAGSQSVDVVPTTILGPGGNGFLVVRFNQSLTAVSYITKIVSAAGAGAAAIAIDNLDRAYVGGNTLSSDFPVTVGAVQPGFGGSIDAFILRLDPTGSSLDYSTYLGGGAMDEVWDLRVDSAGTATVAGWTSSDGFPVTAGALQTTRAGSTDLFISRLSPNGTVLWYSTYLGGSQLETGDGDSVVGIDLGSEGEVALVSQTKSPDFPTTPDAIQPTMAGTQDGTVAVLSMLPTGVDKLGSSTPGCHGKLAIGVTSMPKAPSPGFALTSTNGAASAAGFLGLGIGALQVPVAAKGTQMWIDATLPFLLLPVISNDLGFSHVPLPITHAVQPGLSVHAQFFWKDSCGPSGWSASNALSITTR